MMDYNKILISVGDFGPFQAFVFLLAAIVQLFVGMHMLANVFLMGEPKHRCYVPNCDNSSSEYFDYFTQFTIPNVTDRAGINKLNQCERYEAINGTQNCEKDSFNFNRTIQCSSYVYDHSFFVETVISHFNVVCERSNENAISQSVFMVGFLCGAGTFGIVSDRFGRKTAVMLSSIVLLISSIGTYFSTSLEIYTGLRFITAAGASGVSLTSYILAVEYIGTPKRLVCSNILQMLFAVGELILALMAYFVRKWRNLELMIAIPCCILLTFYWLLPESARWLIAKGKNDEAKKIILNIARWNKVTLTDDLLKDTLTEEVVKKSGPMSLIRTPRMRKWSLIIFTNWIVNAMVYYGLSLGASNLSSNVYANFALLAAVELPAVLLATWVLMHCGRRPVFCGIMIFCGLACGCTAVIPSYLQWLTTTMAVLGKSAIAASFTLIYIYTAEIYPTTVRSTGMGLSSLFSRLGGIVAPFINELKTVYEPFPMIIFGISSVVAGLLALCLPETYNQHLPETVEEAENFATDESRSYSDESRTILIQEESPS